jgi:ribonuclease VapC
MPAVVLDSSAVIALLRNEPGAELVATHIADAVISAVNLHEVAKKLFEAGFDAAAVRDTIGALELEVRPHDAEDAYLAASLTTSTKRLGRGPGDRSCMALAVGLGVPALTTDRDWAKLDIPGLTVQLIR